MTNLRQSQWHAVTMRLGDLRNRMLTDVNDKREPSVQHALLELKAIEIMIGELIHQAATTAALPASA